MHRRIYLDNAATTPTRAEVVQAMQPFFGERFGNASSLHAEGRQAREALEDAREAIRAALRADAFDVVFTSGGTEADNAALVGTVLERRARGSGAARVVTSAIEHPAILSTAPLLDGLGAALHLVPVDGDGRVAPDTVCDALVPGTSLLSIMAANNETGTLEPIEILGAMARERGVPFHTDAVQVLGKLPLDLAELPVDLVTISAHKIHGPKGIAALLVRRGTPFAPLVRGGPQEGGLRGGTEAVALAAGFARAVELAVGEEEAESTRIRALRDQLRERVQARFARVVFNTPAEGSSPAILNVSFPTIRGESLVLLLDNLGVAVSTGSACNSGAGKPSHVLHAMGRSEREIAGSIRFSIGLENREADLGPLLERLTRAVGQLERIAPAAT